MISKLQQQQETFVAGFLCWLSYPRSREIWPQSQRPVSSCRITESRERRYFGHGNWLKEMFISSNMRGDIALVYYSAAMMEVCSGQKSLLWFDGFSGRKPFSSTQGPNPRLFFCAAFTSYYEESDRGQTITSKKNNLIVEFTPKNHRNTSKVSLLYSFYTKISKNNDI